MASSKARLALAESDPRHEVRFLRKSHPRRVIAMWGSLARRAPSRACGTHNLDCYIRPLPIYCGARWLDTLRCAVMHRRVLTSPQESDKSDSLDRTSTSTPFVCASSLAHPPSPSVTPIAARLAAEPRVRSCSPHCVPHTTFKHDYSRACTIHGYAASC